MLVDKMGYTSDWFLRADVSSKRRVLAWAEHSSASGVDVVGLVDYRAPWIRVEGETRFGYGVKVGAEFQAVNWA